MRFVLLFSFVMFPYLAMAKDFNNGCGSGWNEKFVPERIRILGVNFTDACATHDNCYSKCLEGGVNYGKSICKQTENTNKEERREICDSNFLEEMQNTCMNLEPFQRATCLGIASLYEIAVHNAGGGSFDGVVVPPEYFDFVVSDAAKNYDFKSFVEELRKIQSNKTVADNNKFIIKVENNRPLVKVVPLKPVVSFSKMDGNGLNHEDKLRYGDVDLSDATNGVMPLTIENLDLRQLDLQKLRNEQRFSVKKP